MLNVMLPYPKPFRALYVIAVTFTALFLLVFVWFGLVATLQSISTAVDANMAQFNTANHTTSYGAYELAGTILTNVGEYLLALTVLGIFVWVLVYSQRKRVFYE